MSLPPEMISYAGNHEDVLLRRAFAAQSAGFYIDVGAHHPVFGSLTKHFSDRGWTGINIEPLASLYSAFETGRPRDINVNVALSNRRGHMTFYEVAADRGLSTLCPDQAKEYESQGHEVHRHDVEVCTLADICERFAPPAIDFLSIDVEGQEREVLEGADLRRFRPRVLLIEAIKPWSTESTHHRWEQLVLEAGYREALFDGVNRIYVPEKEPALRTLLSVPVNCVDRYVSYETVQLREQVAAFQRRPSHFTALFGRARQAARRVKQRLMQRTANLWSRPVPPAPVAARLSQE
jgi:FkbM family methyltransferase